MFLYECYYFEENNYFLEKIFISFVLRVIVEVGNENIIWRERINL